MKFFIHFCLLALTLPGMAASEPGLAIISDLNQKLLAKQKTSGCYEKTEPVSPAAAPTPVVREDFSSRVSFLTDGNLSVMIPKGALIHAPANHRISIREMVVGKLVEWDEFIRANRTSVRLEAVDLDLLQGNAKLNPEVLKAVTKADLPTLTVYQNRVVLLPASSHPLTTISKP